MARILELGTQDIDHQERRLERSPTLRELCGVRGKEDYGLQLGDAPVHLFAERRAKDTVYTALVAQPLDGDGLLSLFHSVMHKEGNLPLNPAFAQKDILSHWRMPDSRNIGLMQFIAELHKQLGSAWRVFLKYRGVLTDTIRYGSHISDDVVRNLAFDEGRSYLDHDELGPRIPQSLYPLGSPLRIPRQGEEGEVYLYEPYDDVRLSRTATGLRLTMKDVVREDIAVGTEEHGKLLVIGRNVETTNIVYPLFQWRTTEQGKRTLCIEDGTNPGIARNVADIVGEVPVGLARDPRRINPLIGIMVLRHVLKKQLEELPSYGRFHRHDQGQAMDSVQAPVLVYQQRKELLHTPFFANAEAYLETVS